MEQKKLYMRKKEADWVLQIEFLKKTIPKWKKEQPLKNNLVRKFLQQAASEQAKLKNLGPKAGKTNTRVEEHFTRKASQGKLHLGEVDGQLAVLERDEDSRTGLPVGKQ